MDKVKQWLDSLGVGEYVPLFAANHIDFEVLRDLSDADLKDIGVASLGHRRKLIRAIASLPRGLDDWRTGVFPGGLSPPVAGQESARGGPSASAVERRNLTITFFDLVGFEGLAARLDLEELGDVVHAFHAETARAVGAYDGFAARCSNDRVMAYFGYPRAHEDDAERAVRAAADVLCAVARSRCPAPIVLRIAIATGVVVVGEPRDGPARSQRSLTGEAPNLAARLQEIAEPNTIVVSAATRQLLGALFDLRDLGLHMIKGLAEPVRAFAIAGASQSRSRFEAHGGTSAVFIGRKEEREHLLTRRKLAWQGRGQAVLITGESGIGKSRLGDWLVRESFGQPHLTLRCQCTPHHRNTALYPVISQMERAAGFSAADTPEQKLAKLQKSLTAGGLEPSTAVPRLAAVLLPAPTGDAPVPSSSPKLRQRAIEAVLDQLEECAKGRPVLFFCEDAQWADAASLEALDLLVHRIARLPVLALITARPEFSPTWAGRHNVSVLTLPRLDRRQSRAVVESAAAGAELPDEVLEQILAKTDGIPLYIEELTKMVLESGMLGTSGDGFRVGPLPPLTIPSTLRDSLMARLDRSVVVREAAQVGAAIGREFSYAVLVRVAGMEEGALRDALLKLEETQLASRRGVPPDASYTFKHALVQDAAYDTLLKSRRQAIHQRIAQTLRDDFPVLAETEPETIARHFTLAGSDKEAIGWWTRAGELALRKSAYSDAIVHLEKAIMLSDRQPAASGREPSRFRLQVAFANAQLAMHGYTGRETTAAFMRCVELGGAIQDVVERFAGFYGMWASSFASGQARRSCELINSFLEEVGPLNAGQETLVGCRLRGLSRWCTGDYPGAVADLETALAAYDPERDAALAFRFGQDLGLSTMIKLALAAWTMGRVEFARDLAERAVESARALGHMQTLAYVCCYKGCFEAVCNSPDRAGPEALATLKIGRNYDLNSFWVGLATSLRGWTRWRAGEREAGAAEMQEGFAVLRRDGIGLYQPLCDALWSEIEAERDLGAAVAVIDRALATSEASKQVWFDAELHRRRGAMLSRSSPIEAEASLTCALGIARAQGARMFAMRAALDLARLYRASGRPGEAAGLLQTTESSDAMTPSREFAALRRFMVLSADDETVGCPA